MKNINIRRQGNNVDEFNTGIHRDYVNDWGLWEAIREIVQNFKDAIIVDNGKDDNITWTPDDDYLNWKIESANSVELGAIEYSTESQTLKFINNGTISTRCLLLGGSLKSGDVLAGRYGEGLKLAALVFLRTQKSFKVHTGKKFMELLF